MRRLPPESLMASLIGFIAANRDMSRLIASQLPETASQVHRLLIERNLNTSGKKRGILEIKNKADTALPGRQPSHRIWAFARASLLAASIMFVANSCNSPQKADDAKGAAADGTQKAQTGLPNGGMRQ